MANWIYVPGSQTLPELEQVGGKAYQLAKMSVAGLKVPAWFCLRAAAFDAHGQGSDAGLPAEILAALQEGLAQSGLKGRSISVRSSAVGEDGLAQSYAGQFETVLGVDSGDPAHLQRAVKEVWASARSVHALAYAKDGARLSMAVVLQQMIDAESAGVAFSADPVSGALDTAVVSAVYGLGEGLVSGELDADTWRIGPGSLQRQLVAKPRAWKPLPGGGCGWQNLSAELSAAAAISDEEAHAVARAVRGLASAWGQPLDMEWAVALEDGRRQLFLLQARPITTLPASPGERRLWDNSNIAESYNGVTTPLTFSFARHVYEEVYRQFGRILNCTEEELQRYRNVHANMLGLVRGRIYYNLLNWYRALAALPGFKWNRGFMERMMGVRESLELPPPPASGSERLNDLWRMLRMLGGLVSAHRGLERSVRDFQARVDRVLLPLADDDLFARSPDELAGIYRRLEDELLFHWHAPLVNDFFAMLYFGVLSKMIEAWLPGLPPTLANDLICGEGGIISTEPARRLMGAARQAAADPALRALFEAEPSDAALWQRLGKEASSAAFYAGLKAYLKRFGDRCMDELKLETISLSEEPAFIIQTIRSFLKQGAPDPEASREGELRIRREAEARAFAGLPRWKRPLFTWVLARARGRVRDRENLRFERTRTFGTVRRVFVALGAHLEKQGSLPGRRDVFWLTKEELLAHVEGTGVTLDLARLVAQRREEFAAHQAGAAPPERFETYGPASLYQPPAVRSESREGDLQGQGCCPGVVRAQVRLVRDPREAEGLEGHILVAERTDPGWTLIFPAAVGILVQRGSLLSHSAIVAREMGIPCVVGIPGLMDSLKDGEWVEMDGSSGLLRRNLGGGTHAAA
jgi:pyruvate,water dikinase